MSEKQMTGARSHQSVMSKEVLNALNIKADGFYVDATFGRGGYSKMILSAIGESGKLIAVDKDYEAIQYAKEHFNDKGFDIHHCSYKFVKDLLEKRYKSKKIDGIVFDFGVSSPQLDSAERGFSFMKDGPLDMRMDTSQGLSAADWLEAAKEKEIAEVLFRYGNERYSRKIARAIVDRRSNQQPVKTTKDLAELIVSTIPSYQKGSHPATKTFQAIRIHVNDEIEDLEAVLKLLPDIVAVGGRVVFVTFHSLEHRLVKDFIQKVTSGNEIYSILSSVINQRKKPSFKRIGKAIKVSNDEVLNNRRSRSAWMRVVEKVPCNTV